MTVSDDEEPRARAALARLADPAMLDQVARRTGRRLAGPPRLDVRLRAPELHVDPATWRTGFVSVEREVDIPQELKRDLQELTPQAILRDLHRPVRQSIWHEREPVATDVDPGGRRAYAEARAALVREPLAPITPASRFLAAELRRRRAFLAETWQPWLRDDEPRREVIL